MREIEKPSEEKIEQDIQLLLTWTAGWDQEKLEPVIELIRTGMVHIPYFSTTKGPVLVATEYGKAVAESIKARSNTYVQ